MAEPMRKEMLNRLRETKFAAAELEEVRLDGVFTGYASIFGEPDLGNDVVEKGAFSASLARRGAAGVRMLFQHDPQEPIGVWTQIGEDARGLRVTGRLATSVARAGEVLELMRACALDGLSIGFRTVRAAHDRASGLRRILEADLWEISVVTFPMQPEARVETVKNAAAARRPSVREFERWLTRDAGLSRGDARLVIAKGYAALAGLPPGAREAAGHVPGNPADLARRFRAGAMCLRKSIPEIHPKGR
jgi:HK97 family phage prohead protease